MLPVSLSNQTILLNIRTQFTSTCFPSSASLFTYTIFCTGLLTCIMFKAGVFTCIMAKACVFTCIMVKAIFTCITFSAGIGRTGTYIALDILSQEGQTEQAIDVPRCVRTIRQYRTNLVQTVVCGQCDVFWCIRFGKVTCCMSNINRMQWCICFIGNLNTVLPLNSVNNN